LQTADPDLPLEADAQRRRGEREGRHVGPQTGRTGEGERATGGQRQQEMERVAGEVLVEG